MPPQQPKSALMSKTLHFLAAGGMSLAVAVWREIVRPDPDWGTVAALVAGILITLGGGTYGRTIAQGPISGLLPKRG